MREHHAHSLTLRHVSKEMNLTREYFCRLFKAETGITPAKYIKKLRLEKGKELLEDTLLSVKQITHQIGLNDESHFVKDFKNAYGLTPSRYRSKNFTGKSIASRYSS